MEETERRWTKLHGFRRTDANGCLVNTTTSVVIDWLWAPLGLGYNIRWGKPQMRDAFGGTPRQDDIVASAYLLTNFLTKKDNLMGGTSMTAKFELRLQLIRGVVAGQKYRGTRLAEMSDEGCCWMGFGTHVLELRVSSTNFTYL